MRNIKDIDREHNGYVTATELDDIVKLAFPALLNRDLKDIFRPYASIQNKILIDYKKFRDFLLNGSQQQQSKAIQIRPKSVLQSIGRNS